MGPSQDRNVLICESCGKRWHAVARLLPWQRRCLACGGKLVPASGPPDNDEGDGQERGGGSFLVLL